MRIEISTDATKNFIRCVSGGEVIRWVRWGWVEDNIITKYMSFIGETGRNVTTFRSVQEKVDSNGNPILDMESVLIQDHPLLRASVPSHSLIFKSTMKAMGSKPSEKENIPEYVLSQLNTIMVSEDESGITRRFDHPLFNGDGERDGLGYLRNIFINVEEIQSAFGIEIDNIGNANSSGYYSKGINPASSIRGAILKLMGDVSQNFFGIWRFDIITDVNDIENSLLVDEVTQPIREFAYTRFLDSTFGNPAEVSNLGVYQFPSMGFSSLVKAQTFDVSLPKGMQNIYFFGANSYNSQPSTDPDNRSAQMFAKITDFASDLNAEKDELFGMTRMYTTKPTAGFLYGDENAPINLNNGGYNHKSNLDSANLDGIFWKKYAPVGAKKISSITFKDSSIDNRPLTWADGKFKVVESLSDTNVENLLNDVEGAVSNLTDSVSIGGDNSETVDANAVIDKDKPAVEMTITGIIYTSDKTVLESNTVGEKVGLYVGNGYTIASTPEAEEIQKTITVDEATKKWEFIDKVGRKSTLDKANVDDESAFSGGNVNNDKSNTAINPTKTIKVTSQAEEIEFLYVIGNSATDNSSNVMERMVLKPNVEKLARTLINSSGKKGKSSLPPFNGVTLSLTIDGIGGLLPGNMFQVDYAPAQYNKSFIKDDTDYGPLMYFNIADLKQEITSDGWSTSFTGIARANPVAVKEASSMEQQALDDYFSLEISREFGMENMPTDYLGKIKDFITVVGDVADSVTNFFGAANAYKKEKDAEKEKKKTNQIDGQVVPVSEQDSTFFERTQQAAINAGKGTASVLSAAFRYGTTTVEGVLGGFNVIGADAAQRVGLYDPSGGDKSTVTTEVEETQTVVTDKSPEQNNVEVDESVGAGNEDVKDNMIKRITDWGKARAKKLRTALSKRGLPKMSDTATELLDKIKFTHQDVSKDGDSRFPDAVLVEMKTTGEYNGEVLEEKSNLNGTKDEEEQLRNKAKETNERILANRFAEKFPEREIEGAGNSDSKPNPGYPFTNENYYKEGSFGTSSSVSVARRRLAESQGFDGYTAYANEYQGEAGLAIRKNHWDSNPDIW